MNKFVGAAVAALSIGAAAEAATINTTVEFTQDFSRSGNALKTRALVFPNSGAQGFDSASFSGDLTNVGDSISADLFVVMAVATQVQPEHANARPFELLFTTNVGSATISGTTFGATQGGLSFGVMDVTGPAFIKIGGNQRVKISMGDVFYNEGPAGFYTPGKENGGIASVTLTLAEVPVPASFPLLAVALGGMAWLRRRATKAA